MKRYILSALLILSYTAAICMKQTVYDELIVQLQNPNISDRDKTDIYNKLSYESIRTDPELVRIHADSALAIAQRIDYPLGMLLAHKNMGNYYMKDGIRVDSAVTQYKAALSIAEKLDDRFHAAGLNNNLGLLYREEGQYELALYHLMIAKGVYEYGADTITYLQGLIYTNIAETYLNLGELSEAKDYYTLTDSICVAEHMEKVRHMSITGSSYTDYLIDGDAEKAESRIIDNLPSLKKLDDQESIIKSYNTIALISIKEKQWERGLQASQHAISHEYIELFTKERCNTLINLIRIYNGLQRYKEAIVRANEAHECSTLYNTLEYRIEVSKEVYKAYIGLGQIQKATKEHHKLTHMMDQLIVQQKHRIKEETSIKYEMEMSNAENRALLNQQKSQKLIVTYLATALVAFVLMSILVGFFHFKKRIASEALKTKNKLLSDTQLSLERKNKDLEKYIESNIQLEQFAHIASHDLKSPLRTIKSFIGQLERSARDKLDVSENMYLNMVSDAADDMYALVSDLLDYSKVNALNLSVTETDLTEIVDNVTRQLSHAINEKNASISIHDLPEQPIHADNVKMRQVMQNLIANAIKFVPKDRAPQIDIRYTSTDQAHIISVSDNGIGIDSKYHNDVFTPFKRLHTKTEFAGTGLGLSLVERIIEKHKGRIWIEPNQPQGSKFIFEISKSLKPERSKALA